MKRAASLSILFLLASADVSLSQKTDSLVTYYYPSGVKSSQGYLNNKKPNGYWKNWYENGNMKSEGNRKNFVLDSTWKFYDIEGKLTTSIEYKEGKKNGRKTLYDSEGNVYSEEYFVNDVRDGDYSVYHKNGKLRQTIRFEKGVEQGISYELNNIGVVVTIIEYKNGYVVRSEKVNRIDKFRRRQGRQVEFFQNMNIETDCNYTNDKKDGYYKVFDENGNLISITKYIDDIPVTDAAETAKLDIKREYHPNAREKSIGSYKNGVPEGITRYYDENGKIIGAKLYREGVALGEGVVDGYGLRQGKWKEFYDSGELRAEGSYMNNKRIGNWKFYFKNGSLEQNGTYTDDKPEGKWTWYFPNGNIKREENYYRGFEDGESIEYNDSGKVVTKGNYIEGEKDGEWFYENGDFKEIGSYRAGSREGGWKAFYEDGKLLYEAKFTSDRFSGKYTSYWPDGKTKQTGKYVDGQKEGDWVIYKEDGLQYFVISYRNGSEVKYDGTRSDVETEVVKE